MHTSFLAVLLNLSFNKKRVVEGQLTLYHQVTQNQCLYLIEEKESRRPSDNCTVSEGQGKQSPATSSSHPP